MSTSGNVAINIQDNGGSAVNVPSSSVQVVAGCAASGTVGQVVATKSLKVLLDTFAAGPLLQAAGLAVLKGAVVLAMRIDSTDDGFILGSDRNTVAVTGASNVSPIVITAVGHNLVTGAVVVGASVGGNTGANGTFVINVLSSSTFELAGSTGSGSWTSGGTIQFTGVIFLGTGTSKPTLTGAPYDNSNIQIKIVNGGTRGTAGILFTVSLDAGRTKGRSIRLGTATTYAIPGTGVTWNIGAGTLVAGDEIRFTTVAPEWGSSDLEDGLTALQASSYSSTGWGSMHIVGVCSGAEAATLQDGSPGLEQFRTGYIFTRAIVSARDAKVPAAWGGLGETESTWTAAILADFASASANRISPAAGYYNIASAFANPVAGAPICRRPLAWAYAARQVAIPPQRHAGRVRDGGLSFVILDPVNDPTDGFVYHDERVNPSLDGRIPGGVGRFASAWTRIGKPGLFIVNPMTLADPGSDFELLPRGNVMDIACDIIHQVGQDDIDNDIRLNNGKTGTLGTIVEGEAQAIEARFQDALTTQMISTSMITDSTVSVKRDNNILQDETVDVDVKLVGKGFVLQETVTVGYANSNAAVA